MKLRTIQGSNAQTRKEAIENGTYFFSCRNRVMNDKKHRRSARNGKYGTKAALKSELRFG